MLEQNIKLAESKVQLHKALLYAHQQREIEERRFYYELWCRVSRAAGIPADGYGPSSPGSSTHRSYAEPKYLNALKLYYQANEDILKVQLAELEAQLALYQNMLEEGSKTILPASSFQ